MPFNCGSLPRCLEPKGLLKLICEVGLPVVQDVLWSIIGFQPDVKINVVDLAVEASTTELRQVSD